jgi:hypothetical protein
VIATDPGTITRVQGVGFSSPKTRVVTDLKNAAHYAMDMIAVQVEGEEPNSALDRLIDILLTVYNHIKLQVDLQADKSPVVVKEPFFPRVVNPRYRIHGTICDATLDLLKPRNLDLRKVKP